MFEGQQGNQRGRTERVMVRGIGDEEVDLKEPSHVCSCRPVRTCSVLLLINREPLGRHLVASNINPTSTGLSKTGKLLAFLNP